MAEQGQKNRKRKNNNNSSQQPVEGPVPVLPLGDVVVFPGMLVPLVVSTGRSIKLINDISNSGQNFVSVLQIKNDASDDQIRPKDLHRVGCTTRLVRLIRFPDDTLRILVQGIARCDILEYTEETPYLQAKYRIIPDVVDDSLELAALTRNMAQRFQDIVAVSPMIPEELRIAVSNIDDPVRLADLIAANINLPVEQRQIVLGEARVQARLEYLAPRLQRELELLQLGSKIQDKVSETFTKTQREMFLREQLRVIRTELGEEAQQQSEQEALEEKIKKAGMPEEVLAVAEKEKKRLFSIPPASPEYAMVRSYMDWLVDLPWSTLTTDKLDIRKARRILDRDHYDLKKVKDRILEYLSVLKLKHDMKGPILCFVGPPGVGKTSLGQSIARSLGRKFIRMSLGGIHDEAEIRGHRRTYIGALPGRIIQGLKNAGTRNPVFMLDEVDKIGVDFRGDPASALLEVLDPEQNFSFSDHYLDVPFDLSHVLFITTANVLDTIPDALRDRMEVLDLSGYTVEEKRFIAEKFLVPKQIEAHGLKNRHLVFRNEAIEKIITDYTREAGVRSLERQLASVCRKVAKSVAEGRPRKYVINKETVREYLGPVKYEAEVKERVMDSGIATGLAWTPAGGEILFIEATQMRGKGDFILTGSLGDVMKESARAAWSYLRSNVTRWLDHELDVRDVDIHIHVPSGAIPKDGPSAGLAMTLALLSLMANKPLKNDVAMTGEITLRGKVMPVGGIKEKILAAARAGVRHVILPKRNRHDLDDIPPEIRRKIDFTLVDEIGQAIKYAFGFKEKKTSQSIGADKEKPVKPKKRAKTKKRT